MKKINAIDTLSRKEQSAIIVWYTTTIRILLVVTMMLILYTGISLYYQRISAASCVPRISLTDFQSVQGKHNAQNVLKKQQQQIEKMQSSGKLILDSYAKILQLHSDQLPDVQLTELQLLPTGIKIIYVLHKRAGLQQCIERLVTSLLVERPTVESIEQKNTGTSVCTIQAAWKKEPTSTTL